MNDTARIKAIGEMEPWQVLYLWRFEPSDSPWFQGEVGHALAIKFKEIQAKLSPEKWAALSKQVGWEKK